MLAMNNPCGLIRPWRLLALSLGISILRLNIPSFLAPIKYLLYLSLADLILKWHCNTGTIIYILQKKKDLESQASCLMSHNKYIAN